MTAIGEQRYWDGGLFSNLPLSPAINALEEAAHDDPAVVRELIVVELFPMHAPIPRTLPDVLDRMIRLQYTSRLTLDEKLFDKINGLVDLIAQVERELPPDSPLKRNQTYRSLLTHRRINYPPSVVTSTLPADLSNPSDFSRSTIDARITRGYEDARKQGIGSVNSPGLRPGTTDGGGQAR